MRTLFALLISSMILGAQAPADTSFYAVAYVDVMPASKTTASTAFKQYHDASHKDYGFVRMEFFELAGRPGHLAIIETWVDAKAFDTHSSATHTKDWRTKIDSIRLSDYDQRPYKTLSLGATAPATYNRATYVITHVDIGGQGTNAPELLRKLAENSRKEEGNLRFDVIQHAMRANHFTVIEAWQNQKAQDNHAAAAHTRQYRDTLGPISGGPLDERIYKVAE